MAPGDMGYGAMRADPLPLFLPTYLEAGDFSSPCPPLRNLHPTPFFIFSLSIPYRLRYSLSISHIRIQHTRIFIYRAFTSPNSSPTSTYPCAANNMPTYAASLSRKIELRIVVQRLGARFSK